MTAPDPSSRTWAARMAHLLATPARLRRARRRDFRAFLAFSAIDNHTLDDIGLRRSIFTAAPSNDNAPDLAGDLCCDPTG